MEPQKREVDQIVDALVRMRLVKFASRKTMLEFLMNKLGYQTTQAYELIKKSKEKIAQMYAVEHGDAFDDAIARLDAMLEDEKSNKLRLEIEKEKNKLLGLHRPTKVDVTSNGKELFSGIDVSITYSDKKKSDDEA